MFTIREGKSLIQGQRVEVYYNLHQGGFSIKSLEGEHKGIVVAYSSTVKLDNCTFNVNMNAHSKIMAERRKRVYAVVRGYYSGTDIGNLNEYKSIKINPYNECPKFHTEQGNVLSVAETVVFYDTKCKYQGGK